ncbi:MAG: alpha-amylase family protein [Armatimonadota bacterium]
MRITIMILAALLLINTKAGLAMDTNADNKTPPPMKIRFYTGNLSVGHFMEYWGTGGALPTDVPTSKFCDDMKSVSVSSVTDYLSLSTTETEPGKFDWSYYDRNQQILQENGLGYNVFTWLHFPPKWLMDSPDYVPYRCAEHDQPIKMTSLWAPGTLKIYDRFYKELAAHFGDKIEFIRLATPSEYGEIGYPNGMTNWLVKQDHAHEGYWCNDAYARADFSSQMKKRYKNIEALNKTWGTGFKSFDALEYPDFIKDHSLIADPLKLTPQVRMRVLDFIDWYYDSQSRFIRSSVSIVRKYFPNKEIIVSMGYGSQLTAFGNDDTGIAQLCKELKVSCQTPGNVDYICLKSLATPCHFYGVPYFTEPPGDVNRNAQINRIWADSSCGVQTFFDYPQNLLGAKDEFAKYRDYLDGAGSIVEAAVLFPTTDHRLRYEHWPTRTLECVNVLREVLDYDLVDERLIRDGALDKYKILLAYDGNIMEASTLRAIKKWVSSGGILLVRDFGPVETIDGDRSIYKEIFPQIADKGLERPSLAEIVSSYSRKVGKGYVLTVPAHQSDAHLFAMEASEMAYNLSKYFTGKTDLIQVDDKIDGILSTLFKDRIVFLNHGDKPIEKTFKLREADFNRGITGKPGRYERKVQIQPHSIRSISLK